MRPSISSIVAVGLLGYFFWSFYALYAAVQPPLADKDFGPDSAVCGFKTSSWDTPLCLHVYLAHSRHVTFGAMGRKDPNYSGCRSMPVAKVLTQSGYVNASTSEVIIANPMKFDMSSEGWRRRVEKQSLEIPEGFRDERPVYLHSVATDPATRAILLRGAVMEVTKKLKPEFLSRPTRYLLADPDGKKTDALRKRLAAQASDALFFPPRIQVGPITETRDLSVSGLENMGLRTMVSRTKSNSGRSIYLFPLHVNTMVAPRDEYLPMRRLLVENPTQREEEAHLEEGMLGGAELVERLRKPLSLDIEAIGTGFSYWLFQQQISTSLRQMEVHIGAYEVDSMMIMMGGSGPFLIALTFVVSALHIALSVVSMSADVSFWRQRSSFEGFSPSSFLLHAVFSVIIFFYLRDEGQGVLVRLLVFAKVLLDLWKLSRILLLDPRMLLWWRRSKVEDAKQEVDKPTPLGEGEIALEELNAFEFHCVIRLMAFLLPIVFAVGMYQLQYTAQKGWNSWVIHSLALCAYAGGFVTMTPQLFRNYRLKSVAHLPWKVLTLQAIDTFIDDLFSAIIRMPKMHRLSVFRDDVVFVIYHFQRWLYRKTTSEEGAAEEGTKDEGKKTR